MNTVKLALPERNSDIAIAGSIYSIVRAFGHDLGEIVNSNLSSKAPDWFTVLRQARRAQNQPTYDDFHDLRFLLKEAATGDGIVELGIPHFDLAWKQASVKLRRLLNSWSHNSLEPNLDTFSTLIGGLADLAERSKMTIAADLAAALERAELLRAGKYMPAANRSPDPDLPETKAIVDKARAIEARPPIGSEWVGSPGTRKIRISRQMMDVTENGVSIRNQLGSNPEHVIEEWLRYFPQPNGGEARVADDGAVMAYKRGQAYLIGWLGEKPEAPAKLQGFALPFEYIFTGEDVRDLLTGAVLSKVAREKPNKLLVTLGESLHKDDLFNVTAYGEVFVDGDLGEQRILATVHKDIWFPGHLPEVDPN